MEEEEKAVGFFEMMDGPYAMGALCIIALILFGCGGILCLITYLTKRNAELYSQ